jgi:radical S-adenosyl methionine domain-containing protein 2
MSPSEVASCVRSVNYFISRKCNYQCGFSFHTQKTTHHLSLEQAVEGLRLLRRAGTEKINFAGGEPFTNPRLLGELCKTSHELGMAVSIISNGSLITNNWMQDYGAFVDVLGVSVDSFVPETNAAIGRGGDANNQHVQRVLHVRDLCHKHGIKFKMNTVVCSFNWKEDMSEHVRILAPERWKVFQVLILGDENSGLPGELRDARPFCVSDDEFSSFVSRHSAEFDQLIPEPNNVMQNSYLLLDEDLRFLDCSKGGKVPSESILKVGVKRALEQSGFDKVMFDKRGGIYDWTRDRSELVLPP